MSKIAEYYHNELRPCRRVTDMLLLAVAVTLLLLVASELGGRPILSLIYNLSDGREDVGTVRETFFFNQTRVGHEVLSSSVSDFLIEGKTFEVGGKNKGFDQLAGTIDGYVVADGIEYGNGRTIPLWGFGLSY